MKQVVCFILFVTISFQFGCKKSSQPNENLPIKESSEVLYSNSFESSSDTIEWKGNGLYKLYFDGSPNGGKQSLYITGGDISPQAMVELPVLTNESRLILKFWGRSLHRDGNVRLSAVTPTFPLPTIWISFQDTTWKEYADTLLLPSGFKLQLMVDSNGKMGGDILIDQIQVLKLPQ